MNVLPHLSSILMHCSHDRLPITKKKESLFVEVNILIKGILPISFGVLGMTAVMAEKVLILSTNILRVGLPRMAGPMAPCSFSPQEWKMRDLLSASSSL